MGKAKIGSSGFNSEKALRWLVYIFTFAWWLKWGVIPNSDSISYDNMWAMRTMGYPVFIKFTTLFGLIQSHFPTLLIALLMQLFAVHTLVNFLKLHFNLKTGVVILLTTIFLLPNFIYFIANTNMSECICYPLYLFAIYLLLRSLFEKSERVAFAFLFIVALLVLVRQQFLFCDIVSFFLILYLVRYSDHKLKSAIRLGIFFLISIFCTLIMDRTYHFIKHQGFEPTQATGMQLIVPATFIMQPGDSILFKDPIERGMFDTASIILKMDTIYNYKFRFLNSSENLLVKYTNIYNTLEWTGEVHYLCGIIYKKRPSYKNFDFGLNLKLSSQNNVWLIVNKLTTPFALKLIKAHPMKYIVLYLGLVKAGLGDWLFVVFFFGIFIFSVTRFFKDGNNKMAILLSLACLFVVLNLLLICTLEAPWERYIFYTNYFLFAALTIPVAKWLEKKDAIEH